MQFEIEGDLLRRFASSKAAIIEYQKAAKLEETAFGRDNPDLAFLWRKMAVLCSVRKGMIRSIDFGSADRMNQKWIKGFETSLFEPVCCAIQRGDMFYEDLLFEHARGEYVKAIHIGKRCSEDEGEISSFSKPKPRSSNSQVPKRSQSYDSNIVHDLRELLSGMSNKMDGAQSSHPSTTQMQEWNEHSTYKPDEPLSPVKKENPTEESVLSETELVHESRLKKNSQPESECSTPIRSSSSRPIPLKKVKEEISPATIDKNQQDSTRRKPKKQKSADALTSKSAHSRRRKEKPSSVSSLKVGFNMESVSDHGKKPHSMPSLSRTRDSFQSIGTQGSKEVASVRPKNSQASRARDADIAFILLRSPIAIKPRSVSAIVSRAAKNASKHVTRHVTRHVTKTHSMPLLLDSPPPTPLAGEAKDTDATFLSNAIEENSLPASTASISPSRHGSGKSELASFLSESATTAASLSTRSLSEPSHDSDPDGSIHRESLEKFLSETAKVEVALDNASISEPSLLLGLLAHVQEITALLQRQTMGLKNKLGANGMSEHGEILMNLNSKLADLEDSMEVVSEIEMLFEGCAKILNVAIIKVGEQAVDNKAMDVYRKTFALEKLFINQLSKSFAEVGANLKRDNMMDSPKPKDLCGPSNLGDASVAAPDVSEPIRSLRRPSGGGANPQSMCSPRRMMP
jgi:hypothetical protein